MARLLVYKNKKEISSLELVTSKEYIAGRASTCDILLDDVVFSRQHFKLFYAQNQWTVQSLSKYSQIRLNAKELDYFQLKNKDEFTTFDFKFVFVTEDIPKTTATKTALNPLDDQTQDLSAHLASDFEPTPRPTTKAPEDVEDIDDKTFVPEMSSQEWSVGVPYLIIRKPDGHSQTLRLEGNYWVIGREDSCDVVIEDVKASREHCEIYKKGNSFSLVDKKSSNGTLLNYKKIPANTEMMIKSGDQVQIGRHVFIFEVRDPLFNEKISHLPMNVNEMMDSSSVENEQIHKKVIRLKKFDFGKFEKHRKPIMIGGAILILAIAFSFGGNDTQNKNLASKTPGQKQNEALTPQQREFVEKTYNLAKTLYTQGKYELALTEVEKIHAIMPQYKDSREISQYSKNAIDTLMEQKDLDRKENDQRKLAERVDSIISQCQIDYQRTLDSGKLDDCLAPAVDMDPENPRIKQIRVGAERNDDHKEAVQEKKNVYQSRVNARKRIYEQASLLKKQGRILDAMSTYSRHIASTLPDPERLEDKSKSELKELQARLSKDIRTLKSESQEAYGKKDYRTAIKKLEQAIRLNPQDQDIKDMHDQYSKELTGLVKNLYGDSVLEENLGNIEAAKEKWKKIMSMDMEYGDYYKKANNKLKKY